MKQKVYWKQDEEKRIAAYLQMQGVDPEAAGFIGKVRNAQDIVLEPARRKLVTGSRSVAGVRGWMLQKPLVLPMAEESPPEPQPSVVMDIPLPLPETFSPPVRDELDMVLEELSRALVTRFLDHFQKELALQARGRLTDIVRSVSPEIVAPKKVLRKILVIGLLPQQAGIISQEFGNQFDLRFWKGEGMQRLDSLVSSSDTTVAMTNFMSHSEDAHARKSRGYAQIGGGLSSLREYLTDLSR